MRAIRSAQRLIYIETQFLWSPEIVAAAPRSSRDPPHDNFRMLLPAPAGRRRRRPQRGQLGRLLDADAGAGRLLATTISAPRRTASAPVYVHAKVGIIDDRWLTVGSANLNEHSLFNDTELNVLTGDAELARNTRLRLWSEHTEQPRAAVDGDPAAVIDGVASIAEEQTRRPRRGWRRPRLRLLEHVSRRAARLQGPAPWAARGRIVHVPSATTRLSRMPLSWLSGIRLSVCPSLKGRLVHERGRADPSISTTASVAHRPSRLRRVCLGSDDHRPRPGTASPP